MLQRNLRWRHYRFCRLTQSTQLHIHASDYFFLIQALVTNPCQDDTKELIQSFLQSPWMILRVSHSIIGSSPDFLDFLAFGLLGPIYYFCCISYYYCSFALGTCNAYLVMAKDYFENASLWHNPIWRIPRSSEMWLPRASG